MIDLNNYLIIEDKNHFPHLLHSVFDYLLFSIKIINAKNPLTNAEKIHEFNQILFIYVLAADKKNCYCNQLIRTLWRRKGPLKNKWESKRGRERRKGIKNQREVGGSKDRFI